LPDFGTVGLIKPACSVEARSKPGGNYPA